MGAVFSLCAETLAFGSWEYYDLPEASIPAPAAGHSYGREIGVYPDSMSNGLLVYLMLETEPRDLCTLSL